jgi:superfamily II DNA or RNA helicase
MSASKLIDNGFLVPANIVLFDVPYVNNNERNYHSIYQKYITENDVRNGMINDSVRSLIASGRKVLILVRFISHGKILSKLLSDIPHYFVNGNVDGLTREDIKKDFENGIYKCLIASSVFDIGVDIPCLDALILGGGGKSTVRALQRIGRVIRGYPNKKDAIIVDFFDNAKYLDKHSSIRISVYETEPRFKIKLPKGFQASKIKKSKKVLQKITKNI